MLFTAAKGELGGWWYLTLSFDFSKIPGDQGEMPIFIFIIPKEFSRGDQNHSPCGTACVRMPSGFDVLIWLVWFDWCPKHQRIIRVNKLSKESRKMSKDTNTIKKITKYDPKSASISGPRRTVWNGSSVIFSCALERFGTVQEASNYFELFRFWAVFTFERFGTVQVHGKSQQKKHMFLFF